jgi:protein-ribulosamine 3-kinase
VSPAIDETIAAALSEVFGRSVRVSRRTPLGGGSINQTALVDTTDGVFVVKTHASAPPGFFRAEADGLDALRTSGTSLVIPRVVHCADEPVACLILEALVSGPRVRDFDAQLGRGLAEMHRATAPRFGFAHDNYCGLSAQPNGWRETWPEFYGEARLRPHVERAARAGLLDAGDRLRLSRLIERLPDLLEETDEPPALIHGDLWSGNLHVAADGRPALIDPAVSFSHREAELGMMTLFGGFSRRVFDAYEDAWPLPSGWRERTPIYQLYHLLNHLNLFGAGYHDGVMTAVEQGLAL